MKIVAVLVALIWLGVCGYSIYKNPKACQHLASDFSADVLKDGPGLIRDVVAIYKPTDSSGTATQDALPQDNSGDAAASGPALLSVPIPSRPNWTWTTSSATYHNVKVTKIEADYVTILHDEGGARVPIADLTPDIQKLLRPGFNDVQPKAAEGADKETQDAVTQLKGSLTDYQLGLTQARASNKEVLLHFTGSDWCPYCKSLDSEVLTTDNFASYVATRYVVVTLDFPRTPLPDALRAQNGSLQQKYTVSAYPTLIVIDPSEKVLVRMSGYNPGSGITAVMKALQH